MNKFVLIACAGLLLTAPTHAEEGKEADAGWQLSGDIGGGLNAAPTPARTQSRQTGAIPYLNFDAGPIFARIDTFGLKLLPAGSGNIELLTRVLADGYTPKEMVAGVGHRNDSLPLGLGTLQVTPAGAFMVNLYHDLGNSRGQLLDLMYAAEADIGPVALYPQAGLEYRSAAYVRYFDGTPSYRPGSASSPFVALFAEVHVAGHWYVNGNLRRSWLGTEIQHSPLVRRARVDAGLLALSYRFN